jgi:dihydroorotase
MGGLMIVFRGGTVVDYESDTMDEMDVLIEKGKIVDLVRGDELPVEGEFEVIDVSGLHIMPGFIDLHCHLREPGQEWKEDIESGTKAAASGGFTSVVCMANTDPVNDNPETTRFIIEKAKKTGYVKVFPIASITRKLKGNELTDFGELLDSGAIALSDDGRPVMDSRIMMQAMDYSKMFDAKLILHEEDAPLSAGGCMNEGEISAVLGLTGIPAVSEDIMIGRDIMLAEYTGARIHISHLSTKGGVDLIRDAKEKGISVTAETAPHYLTLTENDVLGYNTKAKMNPPLRREEDKRALVEGIGDGTIDCVATDHAPHEDLVKNCEFQEAANGIIGFQTAFPLLLEIVESNGMDIKVLVKLLSYNPSLILNINGGSIKKKGVADLAIVDMNARYNFTEDKILSKSKNSPFIGREMRGKIIMTVVNGKIIYRHEQVYFL